MMEDISGEIIDEGTLKGCKVKFISEDPWDRTNHFGEDIETVYYYDPEVKQHCYVWMKHLSEDDRKRIRDVLKEG